MTGNKEVLDLSLCKDVAEKLTMKRNCKYKYIIMNYKHHIKRKYYIKPLYHYKKILSGNCNLTGNKISSLTRHIQAYE